MEIPRLPPSDSSHGSSPVIHRRRISDADLERLVLSQIQENSDFTLFTPKFILPSQSQYHGHGYGIKPSHHQKDEHDENLRVLQSRSEFSRMPVHVSSTSNEVRVLSTGKPISEFVPYYVWHEHSGIHCYNLITGETTTGTNATVALNNFTHPHSITGVHNDPKVVIRQVDQTFGIAQAKNEGHVLEINPSLLASFKLNHQKSHIDAGRIEYFEELVLPVEIEKRVPFDVFKESSGYKTYDRERAPESKYFATIKYQGGVRTDSLTGKIIGTECTVMEVVSIKKDQDYGIQQQTEKRKIIRLWIAGSVAGLVLLTGGILGYLSSDSWAVSNTQNILREGISLGDPFYYRNQAEQKVADASPERRSLVASVIADDLVLQDNDRQARSYYSRAVSFDSHNFYARYGVLITDVIAGISCTKTVRQEKVNFLLFTQDKMVPYYTCTWKNEKDRDIQYASADRLLVDLRAAGHGGGSLERDIITARTLSASSIPIRDQKEAFIDRYIGFAFQGNSTTRQRTFEGGGAP